jgi:hypothetical protein
VRPSSLLRIGLVLAPVVCLAATLGGVRPARADPAWTVAAALDLDQDGWTDLIWRHKVTGDYVVWYMTAAARTRGEALSPGRVAPGWQLLAPC